MREIKFRCFYRGKMYDVIELRHGAVNGIEMEVEGLGLREVSPDSEHIKGLMQFTGLKDKSGKEIYEGDIVEVDNTPEGEPAGSNDVITICKFEDGAFQLEDERGGHWNRQFIHQPHRLTIIGNIFENPEMKQ